MSTRRQQVASGSFSHGASVVVHISGTGTSVYELRRRVGDTSSVTVGDDGAGGTQCSVARVALSSNSRNVSPVAQPRSGEDRHAAQPAVSPESSLGSDACPQWLNSVAQPLLFQR